MALSVEEAADVAGILQEHPDWPTSKVRAEAGLPNTALFAVKRIRKDLGIPEPMTDGKPTSKGRKPASKGRRPTSRAKAGQVEEATLDSGEDFADDPSGPGRPGGPKKLKSVIAPAAPQLVQLLAIGAIWATGKASRGHAPMVKQQAVAVAVPAVRLADRQVAKYIKVSGKVTEDQEDIALIALAILGWLAGWIFSSITQGQQAKQPVAPSMSPLANADLYSGSEPSGPSQSPPVISPSHATTQATSAPSGAGSGAGVDDSDLFAGSEPAAGAIPLGRPSGPAAGPAMPGASEAVWAAIMPPDLGEGMVS